MGISSTGLNRASLTQLANSICFDKTEINNDIEHLRTVKDTPTPLSINQAFQPELHQVCSIHRCIIERAIQNIQSQHSVRTLFRIRLEKELSFDPLDLETLDQMVKDKLRELHDLKKDMHEILVARGLLTNRIMSLTSLPNPGQSIPGFWDVIKMCTATDYCNTNLRLNNFP